MADPTDSRSANAGKQRHLKNHHLQRASTNPSHNSPTLPIPERQIHNLRLPKWTGVTRHNPITGIFQNMSNRNADWRFPPTAGGAEQGNSPGQHHFANDVVKNMVRETLQNSLDHPEPGLDEVCVTYQLIHIKPKDIDADKLVNHIRAASLEATKSSDPDTNAHYQQMIPLLQKSYIPCLAIIDTCTTGLRGNNWHNLLIREGTPTNDGTTTKGGSFGFGKNAPFNLSGCNTVIYSTRFISQAAKGRICQAAGRSQLMTHTIDCRRLQATGFWGLHQRAYNAPIEGPEIPDPFQLQESGTGIFIIAFQPEKFPEWVDAVARTAVTNFFPAIHDGKLKVSISNHPDSAERIINRNSLDAEIESLAEKDPTRHYYEALQREPSVTKTSGKMEHIGSIKLWITTSKEAPRKLAHVNRRGMLITDAGNELTTPFIQPEEPHGLPGAPSPKLTTKKPINTSVEWNLQLTTQSSPTV